MVKRITKKVEKSSKIISSKGNLKHKTEKPVPKVVPKIRPKPAAKKENKDIHPLKQLEEKILEKHEENSDEHKPGIETMPAKDKKEDEKITPIDLRDDDRIQINADSKKVTENVHKKEKEKTVEKNSADSSKTKSIEDNEYKSRVEAILFAVGKYLDEEQIALLCDMDKRKVRKALEELRSDYDSRDNALMIVQEGDSWKINVREKYLSLVRKVVADTELSKSIMETLAVIAWKTPIFQNEIVRIRGNKCYDHIEELVNTGFVTKDKKGRSYILKTTEKFYNYFDIDSKNLHGVMNEAKMPTEQKTLDDVNKQEETTYSREKLLHALETIQTKSIVQTEEDKLSQKQFLEEIHKKIDDASKRTDEVSSELPRPMHETIQAEPAPDSAEDIPAPIHGDVIEEKGEDIVINTDSESGEHHFQKPEQQPQKLKQLTKKQLEKKFREDLQRVKEKTEHKPDK
jgi:segregation and condensation protein B